MIFLSPRERKFKLKKSAFQLAEEKRKERGFGPSDGWTVGPVSPNQAMI